MEITSLIFKILGGLFELVAITLLAGSWLLGEKAEKLEKFLNKLSKIISQNEKIRQSIEKPQEGLISLTPLSRYRVRSIIGKIITYVLVLLFGFLLEKKFFGSIPLFLNIPLVIICALIFWFLLYWISLSIESVVALRFTFHTLSKDPNGKIIVSRKRNHWLVFLIIFIIYFIPLTIKTFFDKVIIFFAIGTFLRYFFLKLLIPIKILNELKIKFHLGHLTALLGIFFAVLSFVLFILSGIL